MSNYTQNYILGTDSILTMTQKINQAMDGIVAVDNNVVHKSGDMMTGPLILSGDPTTPLGAATKQYVDAVLQGLDIKQSVRAATTSNITLSGTQTVDGVALNVGDRVLVMNQTDPKQNGIYIVASGAWTRASDATQGKVSSGMFTFVEEGTVNKGCGFVLITSNPITIGTTPLTFTQFSGAGEIIAGAYLNKNGNTLSHSTSGVTAGTYTQVTVDQYGHVTSGANPTTLAGYGITDAAPLSHVGAGGSAHALATPSAHGFMSSSDKSKLDGIQSNAINQATADSRYLQISQAGQPNGVAPLDATGKVPSANLPPLNYVPLSQVGQANGVAPLDSTGKVPLSNLPPLNYVPQSQVGQPNGVASLDATGKVPSSQLPAMNYIPLSAIGQPNGVPSLDSSGTLVVNQGSTNNVALKLTSTGAGWGSGLQFINTRTYGIYSGSEGSWHFADSTAGQDRLTIDNNGNAIFAGLVIRSGQSKVMDKGAGAWEGFYKTDGTTRVGYIGQSNTGANDLTVASDTGQLVLTGAAGVTVNAKLTAANRFILPVGTNLY